MLFFFFPFFLSFFLPLSLSLFFSPECTSTVSRKEFNLKKKKKELWNGNKYVSNYRKDVKGSRICDLTPPVSVSTSQRAARLLAFPPRRWGRAARGRGRVRWVPWRSSGPAEAPGLSDSRLVGTLGLPGRGHAGTWLCWVVAFQPAPCPAVAGGASRTLTSCISKGFRKPF